MVKNTGVLIAYLGQNILFPNMVILADKDTIFCTIYFNQYMLFIYRYFLLYFYHILANNMVLCR